MSLKNGSNLTRHSIKNITREHTVDTAYEISDDNLIQINYVFYIIGILILFVTYLGPYFYYKIIKRKSFNPQRNLGVKHVI